MIKTTAKIPAPRVGTDRFERKVRLIDLTREVYEGMPMWYGHQRPFVMTNHTHDSFKERWKTSVGFEAHNWLMSEHTGTHTDAIFEYDRTGPTIDQTLLEFYYGEAICLDISKVRYPNFITAEVLQAALARTKLQIRRGDTILLNTGHGDRTYPTAEFLEHYTGLSREATVWLAEQGIVNIGIDTVTINHSDDLQFSAHMVCADYQIVSTESLTNLDELVGKRFLFFALPLHLRRGTGSPVRAVAWLPKDGVERLGSA
jgi:kynurenine formamidase